MTKSSEPHGSGKPPGPRLASDTYPLPLFRGHGDLERRFRAKRASEFSHGEGLVAQQFVRPPQMPQVPSDEGGRYEGACPPCEPKPDPMQKLWPDYP
jgi:hypothetical protein